MGLVQCLRFDGDYRKKQNGVDAVVNGIKERSARRCYMPDGLGRLPLRRVRNRCAPCRAAFTNVSPVRPPRQPAWLPCLAAGGFGGLARSLGRPVGERTNGVPGGRSEPCGRQRPGLLFYEQRPDGEVTCDMLGGPGRLSSFWGAQQLRTSFHRERPAEKESGRDDRHSRFPGGRPRHVPAARWFFHEFGRLSTGRR
jgi:hypothetical protein